MKNYFSENYSKSKSESAELEKKRMKLESLKTLLNQVGNDALSVYKDKAAIESFLVNSDLEKSDKEFETHCSHYFYAEDIKKWKSEIDNYLTIINQENQTNDQISQQFDNIVNFIHRFNLQTEPNSDNLRHVLSDLEQNKNQEKKDLSYRLKWYSKLTEPPSNGVSINESEKIAVRKIAKQNISKIKLELKEEKSEHTKYLLKYETLTNEKLSSDLDEYVRMYLNPAEEELKFQKKQELYRIHYDNIVVKHVHIGNQNRFKGSNDFIALSKEILSEVLTRRIINDEINVLEQIRGYLIEITEKYTEFSDVKLNILKDIFSQVRDISIEYLTEIAEISNYFSRNDCHISQGVSLKIKHNYSDSYPLEWIDNFVNRLEEKAMYTDLFAQLGDKVNIEEMMRDAYLQCGGKVRKIDIKHLLNPKSYFNIDFSMRKSDGTINSGSTGQTYAAIALLCVARLSLIEKKVGGKQSRGLRFMPIDETENIGSNFDMLEKIEQDYDYQIIVISRYPLDDYSEKGRYQYILNGQVDGEKIGTFAIFNEGEDAIDLEDIRP